MAVVKTDLDYVEFYSEKLREDSSFFRQQKKLIDSQIKASRELFLNCFGRGEEFKKNARIYLKKLGF
jgi:hypothetical protein